MKKTRYLKQRRINLLPEPKELKHCNKEYERLKKICSEVAELEKSGSLVVQPLKNYVHIRLVSIVEQQLKVVSHTLIDEFSINAKELLDHDELTIPLNLLDYFKKGQITKGKVITTEYQFTNVTEIGKFFSYINGVDRPNRKRKKPFNYKSSPFFDWIHDLKHIPKSKDMFGYFGDILKKRVEIVHFLDELSESTEDLSKKVARVQGFVNLFYAATFINLSRNDKEKRKSLEEISKKYFGMSIEEFSKITDKHKIS